MAGEIARVSDERTREALEAMHAAFLESMDHLTNEIRVVTALQREHVIECTGIKRSEEQWRGSLNRVMKGFAESFKEHCDADLLFQREDRADRDGSRKWVWAALIGVITLSWGIIGWLAPIAIRHAGG